MEQKNDINIEIDVEQLLALEFEEQFQVLLQIGRQHGITPEKILAEANIPDTPEQIARRARAKREEGIRHALASSALEGAPPPSERTMRRYQQYIEGEITIEEAIALFKADFGVTS